MKSMSIRLKMVIWFSVLLLSVTAVTFFAVRGASRIVLRNTIRGYLMNTVESNVSQVRYAEQDGNAPECYYLPYEDGYLEIDTDFTEVIDNVYTALYTQDGTILYGENPAAAETSKVPFSGSFVWTMDWKGIHYYVYDRALPAILPDGGTLWIRGIVSEAEGIQQLEKITRLSLIIVPLLLILAVLAGYILSDRMLAPVRSMERTAAEISMGGDLTHRIESSNKNDELGQLAGILNRMLDRLQHSFETEQQFTSDASHELRTPLSVIRAEAEYTLERERSTDEYRESLEVIRDQSEKMNVLINDMLDYTRMDQGADRYKMADLCLSDIVNSACRQQKAILTKGITIAEEIESGIYISGNALLLERMINNLLSNAVRYGKDNGHIFVSLRSEPNKISLSVRDDGIGIPAEQTDKIFGRFYRVDTSRSEKGTGLGLSMVSKIAELHGAEINVDSTVGQGSTFTVIFKKDPSF